MDQIRISKFVAESRKPKNLTRRQPADALSISDKIISNRECGKGLSEVSLVLPLCAALGITANELLSGETVSSTDYEKKAEGNMISLMKDRKRTALSIITGVIAITAVCALIVIVSSIDLPAIVRAIWIVFSIAAGAAGYTAAAMLAIKAGYFECPFCKALFLPSMGEYAKGYHTITKRRLTCPR